MKLGSLVCERLYIGNFVDHVDGVTQKEVNIRVGRIGASCNRGRGSIGNSAMHANSPDTTFPSLGYLEVSC